MKNAILVGVMFIALALFGSNNYGYAQCTRPNCVARSVQATRNVVTNTFSGVGQVVNQARPLRRATRWVFNNSTRRWQQEYVTVQTPVVTSNGVYGTQVQTYSQAVPVQPQYQWVPVTKYRKVCKGSYCELVPYTVNERRRVN